MTAEPTEHELRTTTSLEGLAALLAESPFHQLLGLRLEAYEPAAETAQPVLARVTFYRGRIKAFETEPLEVDQGLNSKTKALPLRFSIPLEKLQPGRYTCQVSVVDPSQQKFAFWRAPVVVLPPVTSGPQPPVPTTQP